ncbi:DNA topoisomerase III, partial [Enterococcus faecium]
MTAKWEVALKQISQKQRTQENFLGQIQKFIQKLVTEDPEQMQKSESLTKQVASQKTAESEAKKDAEIGICPICKQGKIVDKGKFYGCT